MKRTIFLICFCLGLVLSAQQYKTGVILDSIPVTNTKNETFAIYLPTSYRSGILSPILFIFSPSGNGKTAIKVFKKAAENFNYILVCSNNSRNGPYSRNLVIAENLFTHIFLNFNIAENRIYLAGFSGGSRLATSIAVLSGQIEGVIACGAGFSSVPSYRPTTQDFYYAGICGDRDMNYQEMIEATTYLTRMKFKHRLFTFDGNHRWPPNEQILMAFEWFEIEAHKKGLLKKPEGEIKESYIKNYALAKSALVDNQPIRAVERYNHVLKTYGGFFNLDSLQPGIKTLKESNNFIDAQDSREKAFEREVALSEKLIGRYMKDYKNVGKASLKWWDKEFGKLDKLNSKANVEMLKMLERLEYKLFAAAYETTGAEPNVTVNQKEFRNMIISKLRKRLYINSTKEKRKT